MHPCEKCGAPIEERYTICYQCWLREPQKPPYNAQTPPKTVYTPPSVVCAPNAKETAINAMHEENILASAALTGAIAGLADEIIELASAIKGLRQ